MIENLLGNKTAEKVLLYIANYGEGHTSGIAHTFDLSKSQVRKQLIRFESGGILAWPKCRQSKNVPNKSAVSIQKRTRSSVRKGTFLLSEADKERYFRQRRRPRRTGKKLL